MPDLFWPGDHRAGAAMSDGAFLDALLAVENAWLAVLVNSGTAPEAAAADLTGLADDTDLADLATGAERDGNPVTGLVALLRRRAGGEPARWLHRGLTSQDVVDTALMLCLRDAISSVGEQLTAQLRTLVDLTETHRRTPMLARTLTQAALPSTAGMKFATWLSGILGGAETLTAATPLPVQCGGAVGTLAAVTELTGSPTAATSLASALATSLGLAPATPWHTTRTVVTRVGDAFTTCCDAWGHVAADVATGSRTEIGEFAEGQVGGSSTMPHKRNPVLSVLLRRAAFTAPAYGAVLHTASAMSVDERADGGWHAEWAALRTLTRHTVAAASQATDLLAGLRLDAGRAATNLAAVTGLLAEQQAMTALTGRPPAPDYVGAADELIEAVLQRAYRHLKEYT